MRGQWLHAVATFYHTSEQRGSLLEGLRGCLVHDHLKSYFKIADVLHAPCNAQHLRELQALAELDGEAWAGPLQQLLRTAGQVALEYHEGLEPLPRAVPKGRKKRRPGYSLALRLRDYKTETLRFLHEPGVPFTNNQAERDPRMMKLHMKVSGAFRSERRAQDFATLRNVLSTEAGSQSHRGASAGSGGAAQRIALLARPPRRCCPHPATSALGLGVPPPVLGTRSGGGGSGQLPSATSGS